MMVGLDVGVGFAVGTLEGRLVGNREGGFVG